MALSVTRLDLKKFAIRAIHGNESHDVATERVERGIENALDLLAAERRFEFQQDTYDLVTVAPYATGTLTVPSTTSVTFSGSTLPSDIVGQFLEIGGERHWYEITVRGGDTSCTTRFAYNGDLTDGTASTAYKIVYPLLDLPGNFYKAQALVDVEGGQFLEEVGYSADHLLHAERAGTGTPERYAFVPKRNDPNVWQMMMYPAPAAQKQYQLIYFRYPGWYDTATPATSTWKRKATADTDYVDWPDKLMFVLEAAVLAMVAREIKRDVANAYMADFHLQLSKAANFDKRSQKPLLLSRGIRQPMGQLYNF